MNLNFMFHDKAILIVPNTVAECNDCDTLCKNKNCDGGTCENDGCTCTCCDSCGVGTTPSGRSFSRFLFNDHNSQCK